ncbi:MAG: aminotransferase class V-fold PLP-dependent enzyme, partial [Planctomycetota bacterium]
MTNAAAEGPSVTRREHVYLDHAATTPLDARVLDAMLPFLREAYGNASSPHALGREAADAVEEARGHLALSLGADPREVVFTSGATEANNLAIKGACRAEAHARRPARVVTCVTEHHAVLDPIASLEKDGFEVVRMGVDAARPRDPDPQRDARAKGGRRVSRVGAHNQTGVRPPHEAL